MSTERNPAALEDEDGRREVGRRRRVLAYASGAATLLLAAIAALTAIPRGPSEFAYFLQRPGGCLSPLPFSPMTGFTPEQLSSHVARLVLFTPACILAGLALAGSRRRWPLARLPRIHLLALVGALLVAAVASGVLRGVPLQDDEPTYLMQAEILAQGRVAADALPPEAQFHESFTIFSSRGTTGKYPFGEPLVLLPGLVLGVPVLGHIVLAGLTLWLVNHAARRTHDGLAALATVLLAISPQFVFTSATLVSQVPALFGVAVAVWAVTRGGFAAGLWAGTGLGLAFAARPQVAVPCGLALLFVYFWRDRRLLLGVLLGSLPWLAAILLYDYAITGSPWRLPWFLFFPKESYGFGYVFDRGGPAPHYLHTPLRALLVTLVVLVRLNGWALGWPLSLAGPALWFALGRPHRSAVAPWAWVALATFLFQLGYYSPGTSDTGAVYHHAALPFIALSTASAALTLARTRWREIAYGVMLSACLFGTVSFFVEHSLRLRRLTAQVEGPDRYHLGMRLPALLFEDTDPRRRPSAGWLQGIPFRPRNPAAPIVIYPLASIDEVVWLARRIGRHCYFLSYDFVSGGRWALRECSQPDIVVAGAAHQRDWPSARDMGTPWQLAFRWVPGLWSRPGEAGSYAADSPR